MSVVATLTAVGALIVKGAAILGAVWAFLSKVFNWFKDKLVAAFIGSKFWATAAFLTICAGILTVLGTIISHIVSSLSSQALSRMVDTTSISEELSLVNRIVPFEHLLFMLSFLISTFSVYLVIANSAFVYRYSVRLYRHISTGWKL